MTAATTEMETKGVNKADQKNKASLPSSRITMQDLEAMSDDESSGSMPPEDEWDEEAVALKEAIMNGAFDHLLEKEDGNGGEGDDDESIEEVELGSDDEDDESGNSDESPNEADEDVEGEESESSEEEEVEDEQEAGKVVDEETEDESDNEQKKQNKEEVEDSDDSSAEDDDEEDVVNADNSIDHKNQFSSKALHVVTDELANEKKNWAWAETFEIIAPKPLECDDIHDDLKREVAFYDLALEAVQLGRKACQKAGVEFSRPDDFFAEMVKSDGTLVVVVVVVVIVLLCCFLVVCSRFLAHVTLFTLSYLAIMSRPYGPCERPSHFWNQKDGSCSTTPLQQGTEAPFQGSKRQQISRKGQT